MYKFAALAVLIALAFPIPLAAQELVSFPTDDGGRVFADVYGQGSRGVVLAHGGRFNKESWRDQARMFAAAHFRVLAIDFRGYGRSVGPGQHDPLSAPLYFDVLAAVRYLRHAGADNVAVIGASMGGDAAATATAMAKPGEISRLVLLSATPSGSAALLKVPILYIVARDDADTTGPRLNRIRAQYAISPEPKRLLVLDGPRTRNSSSRRSKVRSS